MEAGLERRLKARVFRERRGVEGQSRKREQHQQSPRDISVSVLWEMMLNEIHAMLKVFIWGGK